MSIKTHCITIDLMIIENKVDLSLIQAKQFLRQEENFVNIDFVNE
jgi:hypothetical protein